MRCRQLRGSRSAHGADAQDGLLRGGQVAHSDLAAIAQAQHGFLCGRQLCGGRGGAAAPCQHAAVGVAQDFVDAGHAAAQRLGLAGGAAHGITGDLHAWRHGRSAGVRGNQVCGRSLGQLVQHLGRLVKLRCHLHQRGVGLAAVLCGQVQAGDQSAELGLCAWQGQAQLGQLPGHGSRAVVGPLGLAVIGLVIGLRCSDIGVHAAEVGHQLAGHVGPGQAHLEQLAAHGVQTGIRHREAGRHALQRGRCRFSGQGVLVGAQHQGGHGIACSRHFLLQTRCDLVAAQALRAETDLAGVFLDRVGRLAEGLGLVANARLQHFKGSLQLAIGGQCCVLSPTAVAAEPAAVLLKVRIRAHRAAQASSNAAARLLHATAKNPVGQAAQEAAHHGADARHDGCANS